MKALTRIATLAARAIPGGRVLALLLAAMMAGLLVAVAKDTMARPAPVPTNYTVPVYAQYQWNNTGITLQSGTVVTVTASGTVYIAGSDPGKTPDGEAGCYGKDDPAYTYTAEDLTCYALIAKIGESGKPFEIGSSETFRVRRAGTLYLSTNDGYYPDNSGFWVAQVSVTSKR